MWSEQQDENQGYGVVEGKRGYFQKEVANCWQLSANVFSSDLGTRTPWMAKASSSWGRAWGWE